MFDQLLTTIDPFFFFLADDPTLRLFQMALMGVASLGIFLVFFVTRDIILRTHSLFYMAVCIIIAAVLPGVGFLLYLLIRPPRTIKERELEQLIKTALEK